MSGHTATPWRNIFGRIISDVLPRDGSHDVCSMTVVNNDVARAEANAELIVTACNSHADLVKALEEIRDCAKETRDWQELEKCRTIARAALATLIARKVG